MHKIALLIVEDDPEIVARISDHAGSGFEVHWFDSLDAVRASLPRIAESLDIAICDLRLPLHSGDDAQTTEFGLMALDEVRSQCPGVPAWVYSSHADLDDLKDRLRGTPAVDIDGTGPVCLIDTFRKTRPDKLYESLARYQGALVQLADDVALTFSDADRATLRDADQRLLRIYCKQRGGVIGRLTSLVGGASGASAWRLHVEAANGETCARVVAKLDTAGRAQREKQRVGETASHLLTPGTFASVAGYLGGGARDRGAIFYGWADGYDASLFDISRSDPELAATVIKNLRQSLAPWQTQPEARRVTVRTVLAEFVQSQEIDEVEGLTEAVLDRTVYVAWSRAHLDLHGGNVLVDPNGKPMLIDFARAGRGPRVADPLTLELSLALHPGSPWARGEWPESERIAVWPDLDPYLRDAPCAAAIRTCREWTREVKRSDGEVYATVLGYALRQLRYQEVPRWRAEALIHMALSELAK